VLRRQNALAYYVKVRMTLRKKFYEIGQNSDQKLSGKNHQILSRSLFNKTFFVVAIHYSVE
jgi:hypothetical protein